MISCVSDDVNLPANEKSTNVKPQVFFKPDVWTNISLFALGTNLLFGKIALLAMPAMIIDVSGSIGNLAEKIDSKTVTTDDVTGLASSFFGVVSSFSTIASIGIEITAIGSKAVALARFTNIVGIGLWAAGYAITHHEEITGYAIEGVDFLKEQYASTVAKYNELNEKIESKIGHALYEAISGDQKDINSVFIKDQNGMLAYNFDYLDPTGEYNLKENLEISPSELYEFLNGLNIEQQAEILAILGDELEMARNLDASVEPLLDMDDIHSDSSLHNLFEVSILDMPENNLSLLFMDYTNFDNSPLFTPKYFWNGVLKDYAPNEQYSWVNNGLKIFKAGPDLIYYDPFGEQRALPFPLILDETTGKLLSIPLYQDGSYSKANTFDLLLNEPQLFSTASHIKYNNAHNLAQHLTQLNMMIESGKNANLQHLNMVQHRLVAHRALKYEDVFENEGVLNLKLNSNAPSTIGSANSPISGMHGSGLSSGSTEGVLGNKLCHDTGSPVHVCFNMSQNLISIVDLTNPAWYVTSY